MVGNMTGLMGSHWPGRRNNDKCSRWLRLVWKSRLKAGKESLERPGCGDTFYRAGDSATLQHALYMLLEMRGELLQGIHSIVSI